MCLVGCNTAKENMGASTAHGVHSARFYEGVWKLRPHWVLGQSRWSGRR